MEREEKTIASKTIYEGKIFRVKVDQVRLPGGQTSSRELVEHPGAVGVVPVTENQEIVLVTQYRKPTNKVLLEIPAGKLEPGEEPRGCALRELEEETGWKAAELKGLFNFYTSPGFTNEKMHLFLATGLVPGEKNAGDEEYLETVVVPLQKALQLIESGEIEDAKTIIGLLSLCRWGWGN